MCTFSDFLEILATVDHPFSPANSAEIAEKHIVVENGPLQLVRIVELGLFALSYPEFLDREFKVAVVATVLLDFSRRPSRGPYAFPRVSSRREVPGVGLSRIPNLIGLLQF
jgi:hypothetical protein